MEQLAQQASALMGTTAGLLLLVIGAIAGLIIGLLVAAFGWKRKDSGNAATVSELENELADYKSQVNEHFAKTSQLVGKLTDDYREVYRHLATGSEALCSVEDTDNRIGFDDSIHLASDSVKQRPEAVTKQPKVSEGSTKTDAKKPDDKAKTDTAQGGKLAEQADDKLAGSKKANETKAKAGDSKPVATSIPDKIQQKK